MAIGIWTIVEPGSYDALLGNKGYKTSANLMLAAGAVVMVVGFLGCFGAARESRCMLGWVRTMQAFIISILPLNRVLYISNNVHIENCFCFP